MKASMAFWLVGLVVLALGCNGKKGGKEPDKEPDKADALLLVRDGGETKLFKITWVADCQGGDCAGPRNPCPCPGCWMCEPPRPDQTEIAKITGEIEGIKKKHGIDKLFLVDLDRGPKSPPEPEPASGGTGSAGGAGSGSASAEGSAAGSGGATK